MESRDTPHAGIARQALSDLRKTVEMPVSSQANDMSMLQGAMQQMQMQAQLQPLIQKLMAAKQQQAQPIQMQPSGPPLAGGGNPNPPPPMPGGLAGALGPHPPTLGMGQPIPMQMPPADPQGLQQQPPIPPDPESGAGPQ